MILPLLFLQLLFGVDGAERDPAEIACMTTACYTVHTNNILYEEARMSCEYNGGKLATVKDRTEGAEVRSVLARFGRSHARQGFKFWIGLKLKKGSCIFPERDLKGFQWISGEQDLEYSSWEKEPEITCTEERCVSIHHTSSPTKSGGLVLWTDRSCKDVAGFVCKFHFKGMCNPLILAGPGMVRYSTPFVRSPLGENSVLAVLPHGTLAEVSCGVKTQYTICQDMNEFFDWNISGPFCDPIDQRCKYNNGGCDQLCIDVGHSGVRCECKNGFELGADNVTCVQRDHCKDSPCSFKCIPTTTGFICDCPRGFELGKDLASCIDVDECSTSVCNGHTCRNTQGSYTCRCKMGYRSISGKCEDTDECLTSPCPQGCLNSLGSFSCYCFSGYSQAQNGRGCVDDDECLRSPCAQICTNTIGSFKCSCKEPFKITEDGVTCIPDPSGDAIRGKPHDIILQITAGHTSTPKATASSVSKNLYTKPISATSSQKESTNKVPDAEFTAATTQPSHPDTVNEVTALSDNSVRQMDNLSNTWILACVLGSVAAFLLVIAIVSVIMVCRYKRLKKDTKKQNSTTDSYCWVSTGNFTQIEKLEVKK